MINYFKHDINASSDPKLIAVKMKYKHAGTGLYWELIEVLAQNQGLMKADFNALGYLLRESAQMVKELICDFGLFSLTDDGFFYSNRLNKELNDINSKSQKAKESAKKRWEKQEQYDSNANAMRTQCERIENSMPTQCYKIRQDNIRKDNNINNISPSKNDGGECVQPLLLPQSSLYLTGQQAQQLFQKAKKEVKSSKAEQLQLEADFNFFWTIYPKKQGKKEALKAYLKARKKASHDELLEALREVKAKDWRNRELQYVPHASTWLNQERWNDEVTEAKKIDPLDDLDLESNPFEVNK